MDVRGIRGSVCESIVAVNGRKAFTRNVTVSTGGECEFIMGLMKGLASRIMRAKVSDEVCSRNRMVSVRWLGFTMS